MLVEGHSFGRSAELARLRARLQEEPTRPLYEAVVDVLNPGPGDRVLHAGCGCGIALQIARGRGARVAGIDHNPQMLLQAADLVPGADLREGDTLSLPYAADEFDHAMSFTRLQFAGEPQLALRELVRVTRPGGLVAVGLWHVAANEIAKSFLHALNALLPHPRPGDYDLLIGDPARLRGAMAAAGLSVIAAGEVSCRFEFPDIETAWRAMSTCAPVVRAVEIAGVDTVREVFTVHCAPHCVADGAFRPDNRYQYVVGRVPGDSDAHAGPRGQ